MAFKTECISRPNLGTSADIPDVPSHTSMFGFILYRFFLGHLKSYFGFLYFFILDGLMDGPTNQPINRQTNPHIDAWTHLKRD